MSLLQNEFDALVNTFTSEQQQVLAIGIVVGTVEVMLRLRQALQFNDIQLIRELHDEYASALTDMQKTLTKSLEEIGSK